jgi:hypothetical protein
MIAFGPSRLNHALTMNRGFNVTPSTNCGNNIYSAFAGLGKPCRRNRSTPAKRRSSAFIHQIRAAARAATLRRGSALHALNQRHLEIFVPVRGRRRRHVGL